MPHRNSTDLCCLEASLDSLNRQSSKHLILCGDFNCPDINWGHCTINHNADQRDVQQQLLDIASSNCLSQVVEEPTRQGNVLDLCFTSNTSLVKSVSVIPGLSDHDAVIIDSIIKPVYHQFKKRSVLRYNKADWSKLKKDCTKLSTEVEERHHKKQDIHSLWGFFKTTLNSAIKEHIPSKITTFRNQVPWMNKDLKRMIKKKARLHKQAKKTKNWSNFKFQQKITKKAFRKAEQDFVNKTIKEGLKENNTKPFWRFVKSKKQDNVGISPLLDKGRLESDNKRKAEILLGQFSSVFTKAKEGVMPNVKKQVDTPLTHINITTPGVTKLLNNIKTSKASGPDNIPNMVLKECASELSLAVTCLFQSSIDSGQLPSDWTNANVSPIFKKGDRHKAENYRPVSLTSVLSKLLEHIVCHSLMQHFEKNEVLTSLNHGFRSGYSTETQLAVTIDDLSRKLDKGLQTDVAILDFSKAFDTVPHDRLLHKLDAYGIRGHLHVWIRNFLTTRKMKVLVDGESSSETAVISGVPQGTVLGPILFLVHINDLPDCVTSSVRLFADDCLLYRTIETIEDHLALQTDLTALGKWADDWGMKFNATKCYILPIKKKSNHYYQLNNTILQEVKSNPYLGLNISSDLKWTNHINSVCKKASSTLGFVRRNLANCPKQSRFTAYTSLVRSVLEYGSTIWDPHTQKDIDRLERIQRQAARFITRDYRTRTPGCVSNMLRELDLPSLQTRRRHLRLSFLFKIAEGTIPSLPPDKYLEPIKNKRNIKPKQFSDCVSKNIVEQYVTNNSRPFQIPPNNGSEQYKNSFFIKTIPEWNGLANNIVNAESLEAFKTRLSKSGN